MSFFVFTTLAWVVKKLLSNQLRCKCHYSIRLSCSILKVKLVLSPSQFSVWLKKSLTGTFTWYSSRLHAMFAIFPLLPQESQFPILPAFLVLKFIYSEKATKFCKLFTLLLNGTTKDKSKVKILENFVAFSELYEKKKRKVVGTYHSRW